jgi:peroxiredoxin Q/BCP
MMAASAQGIAQAVITRAFARRNGEMVDLKPGDLAPEFALVGSDGVTYRLREFRDRSAVVLAWFPKAFTGG